MARDKLLLAHLHKSDLPPGSRLPRYWRHPGKAPGPVAPSRHPEGEERIESVSQDREEVEKGSVRPLVLRGCLVKERLDNATPDVHHALVFAGFDYFVVSICSVAQCRKQFFCVLCLSDTVVLFSCASREFRRDDSHIRVLCRLIFIAFPEMSDADVDLSTSPRFWFSSLTFL